VNTLEHTRSGRALRRCAFGAAAILAWLCVVPSARADVVRFGLFVGNNRGADHEQPLRYATSDAQRVQDVLVELGGVAPTDAIVLREANADTARGALIALNDRIRTAAMRPDTQVMLFVYYSGHADRQALHLGKTRLPLVELEQLVRGSAANFRVLLVDACGSGALTRLKGGHPAPPFPIRVGETLDGEGVAFVSSSAASEDAQESDELRGSFFTHYFVSGLMGAADSNHDDRIDLEEAYRYAYESTLRSTSRTWAGPQHPTFRFDLAGKTSVVLSEPRLARRALLVFPEHRDYLVLHGSSDGPVVAEVVASAGARRISVRPDHYFVRGRASDHVLEGEVSVREGETKLIEDGLLERIEYARLVRKGGGVVRSSGGPLGGYTLRNGLKQGDWPCQGLFLAYAFVLPALTMTPRLDACLGGFENPTLRAMTQEIGGDVRISHAWDFPSVTFDIGIAVGTSWLRQSFSTSAIAPTRDSIAFRSSIGPAATFDLAAGLYLIADIAAETYAYSIRDSATRTNSLTTSLVVRARAGIGKQW
jgi:hypothetical protein